MPKPVPSRQRFDYDMARALRAEGVKIKDIASLYGVCNAAVMRQIKGVECPIDHTKAVRDALPATGRAVQSAVADERRVRIRRLRATGLRYKDIAPLIGICISRVAHYGRGVKPLHQKAPELKTRPAPVVPAYSSNHPDWIVKNDLVSDYIDYCRLYGRDAALRACRKLAEEASRP